MCKPTPIGKVQCENCPSKEATLSHNSIFLCDWCETEALIVNDNHDYYRYFYDDNYNYENIEGGD